jgi:hypothetical protein
MITSVPTAALRRLLDALPAASDDHPVDVGVLGEYAATHRASGPFIAAEAYPAIAAHLEPGCNRCAADLMALQALAQRTASAAQVTAGKDRPQSSAAAAPASEDTGLAADDTPTAPMPESIEIADALALARIIEAERDALRVPLRPDRDANIESRRQTARQRHLLLVEAALVRQRLAARRLFLTRAQALAGGSPAGSPATQADSGAPVPRRAPNAKAGLLLGHFAGQVDDFERLAARLGRVTVDIRRMGDDPRGPARPKSEALVVRGLNLTRDALALDQRLMRLQGPLAGMFS